MKLLSSGTAFAKRYLEDTWGLRWTKLFRRWKTKKHKRWHYTSFCESEEGLPLTTEGAVPDLHPEQNEKGKELKEKDQSSRRIQPTFLYKLPPILFYPTDFATASWGWHCSIIGDPHPTSQTHVLPRLFLQRVAGRGAHKTNSHEWKWGRDGGSSTSLWGAEISQCIHLNSTRQC